MKHPLITTGAIGAALIGSAILAGPAAAWDDKPCGATEATAHLCAPGEVARDGTIPNPVATPPPVPVPTPTPEPVVTPPPPPVPVASPLSCARLPKGAGAAWRRKAHCSSAVPTAPTCADLRARKAGLLWFVKFGCEIPVRFRNVGPFRAVPVTG